MAHGYSDSESEMVHSYMLRVCLCCYFRLIYREERKTIKSIRPPPVCDCRF